LAILQTEAITPVPQYDAIPVRRKIPNGSGKEVIVKCYVIHYKSTYIAMEYLEAIVESNPQTSGMIGSGSHGLGGDVPI
jgi:hypothetical protein